MSSSSSAAPAPSQEVPVCSICTDDITCDNGCELGCTHQFHAKCIHTWFKVQDCDNEHTCPNCRSFVPRFIREHVAMLCNENPAPRYFDNFDYQPDEYDVEPENNDEYNTPYINEGPTNFSYMSQPMTSSWLAVPVVGWYMVPVAAPQQINQAFQPRNLLSEFNQVADNNNYYYQ